MITNDEQAQIRDRIQKISRRIDPMLDDIFENIWSMEQAHGWTRQQTTEALAWGHAELGEWYEDWHREGDES